MHWKSEETKIWKLPNCAISSTLISKPVKSSHFLFPLTKTSLFLSVFPLYFQKKAISRRVQVSEGLLLLTLSLAHDAWL